MEVSVISGASRVKIGRKDVNKRELGFCNLKDKVFIPRTTVCVGQLRNWGNSRVGFTSKASVQSEIVPAENESPSAGRLKSMDGVGLYVGLPLDTASECNTVNHARAISAGLRALKLMGVDGVELPVWWGIVEKVTMGEYEWSGYLAVAEMVQNMGLKLQVSLCFHASKEQKIPLPDWISRIGDAQPSIFFTDCSGHQYKECLSLAVDDLPILDGKSPMEVYKDFCESFKATFAPFMGSTIKGITMGLGPDGELRYPSHHRAAKTSYGVGEFQCDDKHMLSSLKHHADASGNPLWGLAGPHDVPSYDQPPTTNFFFKDQGGSWETPYGRFFLSWYSNELISHADRVLSIASTVFGDNPVTISGKVPLIDSWYRTQSHPSELTGGFYNTANKDGYDAVAETFARNSSRMVLPGMDLLDENEPERSSPESLLAQIKETCRKHGVCVSGQNSSVSVDNSRFEEMKRNLCEEGDSVVDVLVYQRMGAEFFSPEHFHLFTTFVRGLNQSELESDDMTDEKESTGYVQVSSEARLNLHAQAVA